MCKEHWRRVPRELHNAIIDGYAEWRRTGKPSPAYIATLRQAVEAITGQPLPDPAQFDMFAPEQMRFPL